MVWILLDVVDLDSAWGTAQTGARMHELSLAQSIVDIVADAARTQGFARAIRVRVSVGVLAHVEPEALAFGFGAVSAGTVAEGAELDIVRPPGEGRCDACGATIRLRERGDPCSECGSYRVEVTGGEDLRVTELEVD